MIKKLLLLIALTINCMAASAQSLDPFASLMDPAERKKALKLKKKRPEVHPIYCSYSETRPAGQGKDFCEFVADNVDSIKVVVCLNANKDDERQMRCEFVPMPKSKLTKLWNLLDELEPWKYCDYEEYDENAPDLTTYRFFIEYGEGREYNARWRTRKPKSSVVKAYEAIKDFFTEWRNQF